MRRIDLAAVPVVEPQALGQVDGLAPALAGGLTSEHWGDQQVAAKQELVLVGLGESLRVAGVVPHETAHQRRATELGLARQGVHQRRQAQLELEVAAVDRAVGLLEPPRVLALGLGPAGHAHQHRREALPLQIARVGFRAAAKDAVDVAGGIDLARQARADQGRDMPADVVPAAALVAGPGDRVTLDAGPAHDGPDEGPRVGVAQDALVGRLVRVHCELVALTRPGHVQLLHTRAGLADLPGDLVDSVLGPQPGAEAVALETLHDLG